MTVSVSLKCTSSFLIYRNKFSCISFLIYVKHFPSIICLKALSDGVFHWHSFYPQYAGFVQTQMTEVQPLESSLVSRSNFVKKLFDICTFVKRYKKEKSSKATAEKIYQINNGVCE